MMHKVLTLLLIILMTCSIYGQDKITIQSKPVKIFVEKGEHKQIINFDFLISNTAADTLSLDKLTVSVFDKDDDLVQTRFLDNNGTAPSIFLLPKRVWEGVSTHLIFNPFSEFEITTPLHRLEYEWVFTNKVRKEFTFKTLVHPRSYLQKHTLYFPLKGRALVYDAHDYTSHHRRFDYNFQPVKELGLNTNFMRYAYDFILLNEENKQFKNDGKSDSDYFGFGSPVYAVAGGKIIYVAAHHKDDKTFNVPKLKENPLELYGNCIAIQHEDSSVSLYGHLKENSIQVKLGSMVSANQELAQVGVSGSSFLPHLHFEMRTSVNNQAEGIPSYFDNILILEGKLKRKSLSGLVETGNILETTKGK